MMKEIIFFSAILALTLAEAPIKAPYPPSGWKPKGAPFTLPKEFLPQQVGELEITKERVDFAGQLTETTTVPSNSYLPPDDEEQPSEDEGQGTEDLLKVQGLPSNEPSQFNQNDLQRPQQQNGQFNGQSPRQFNQNDLQRPQQQNGQFNGQSPRQFQQNSRQQQQQFTQNQQQFGRVQQKQQFNSQFNYQQQQQQQQQQQRPQFGQQYPQYPQYPQQPQPQEPRFPVGSPQFNNGGSFVPQFEPRKPPTQEYGPPKSDNDEDNDENDEDEVQSRQTPATAAQINEQPRVGTIMALSNGRYYVLTPDNTLQRVVFMTTQDEEEARTNGFTAQLRYMPVEPIRDPIYAYNEQGQLIKIFKK